MPDLSFYIFFSPVLYPPLLFFAPLSISLFALLSQIPNDTHCTITFLYRRSLDDDSFYPFILPTAAPPILQNPPRFSYFIYYFRRRLPKKKISLVDPSRKTSVAFPSVTYAQTHTIPISSPFILQSFFLSFCVYVIIFFFGWLLACTCVKAACITLLNHSFFFYYVWYVLPLPPPLQIYFGLYTFHTKKVFFSFFFLVLSSTPPSLTLHLLLLSLHLSPTTDINFYISALLTFTNFFLVKTIYSFFFSIFFCSINIEIKLFFLSTLRCIL